MVVVVAAAFTLRGALPPPPRILRFFTLITHHLRKSSSSLIHPRLNPFFYTVEVRLNPRNPKYADFSLHSTFIPHESPALPAPRPTKSGRDSAGLSTVIQSLHVAYS